MKFTLSWLKDYLQTDKGVQDIAEALTAQGLEVETVDSRAAWQAFVLAKITAAKKHPNADKLQILQVDIGKEKTVQVVCGAPNARVGLVGVFAPPGAYIPGMDITLAVGKIRDVESFGMMCSERELLLSEEHNGIMDLGDAALGSGKAKLGQSFASFSGLDDPIIDVALTPNRGDCASVYGIARDLAAGGIGKLKPPKLPVLKPGKAVGKIPVELEDKEICLGFSALRIDNVKNGSSPAWLQQRLRAAGLTPKNALADISNYIMLSCGQPLHIYDADKLRGSLHIRKAKSGEIFSALNGKTYTLTERYSVLADDAGIAALPGIIGGAATACSDKTRAIILESALWNPALIARMGRELGIVSDARYRFERGVDPHFMRRGQELAAAQILELCGGAKTKITGFISLPANGGEREDIAFPLKEIERLTGMTVPQKTVRVILRNLGFTVKDGGGKKGDETLSVSVPSWRMDIDGKADLVEEVLRIYGVDKITPQPLPCKEAVGNILTALQKRSGDARRVLAARGMNEAISYSFLSASAAEAFGGGAPVLKLANPIAVTLSDMRPSLLPNLLAAVKRNADRSFADLAVFEVGDCYQTAKTADSAPMAESRQRRMAAGVRSGAAVIGGFERSWREAVRSVDCFDAKDDALAVLEYLGISADKMQIERGAPHYFHPGRSGVMRLGPKNILGFFGEFHPDILDLFGLNKNRQAVCGFELFLDALPAPKQKAAKTKPPLQLSPFQPVTRDFSFIVAEDIAASAILRAAGGADKKLIKNVQVFDIFSGDTVEKGKKAVGIAVTIVPQTQNLTDADLEILSAKLVDNVLRSTKGSLR